MDAVQKANSGHPGAPMGMAELPKCCGTIFLNITLPTQPGRSRPLYSFQRSRVDAALQFAHLTGYDLPLEELKNFRQLHSKPLVTRKSVIRQVLKPPPVPWTRFGERRRAGDSRAYAGGQFNQPDHEIVDHFTYVFMGEAA